MVASAAPVVVALMGLPGSGKTTLAQALAASVPARIVSRDSIRAAMFHPCDFTDAEKAAAFDAVLQAVAVNCRLGHSSVVDGMPFSRAGEWEAVKEASEREACRALPVFCSVSVEEAQRRISRQGGPPQAAGDRDEELVAQVARRFRSLPKGTLELDANRPVDELSSIVLERIGATPRTCS